MTNELEQKMALIRAQWDTIQRAQTLLDEHPCHRNAVLLQRAIRQRKELQETLPKLRLVA